jgi:membrane protein DedA with SNARE-associated domain
MDIDWTYWLSTYGLWAVLIGTFLEGESILVAGAIAARHGYMSLESVLLAALIGSFTGDQLYFFLGRIYGRRILLARPKWRGRVEQVHRLLDAYHAIFILGFRFLYGLRTVSPFVLGTSSVSVQRFMPLNFLGALLWSVTVGGLGYMLGNLRLSDWLADKTVAPYAIGAALLLIVCLVALVRRRTARLRNEADQ